MPVSVDKVIQVFNRKPVDTPVIAVTGGKGGTGKTSVAVNLAAALSEKGCHVLLVDTDVDSPTTAIVLGRQPQPVREVKTFIPKIIEAKCNKCGKCSEACRAHALIQIVEKHPIFFEELCSGCEACLLACPQEAIQHGNKTVGRIYRALGGSIDFIGGELRPNETRSAQVVTATKDLAYEQVSQEKYDVMVVDTPPGTHCNVVQGLRGADMALAVTEPTSLGIYDLDLILKLTSTLGIQTRVIINKADIPGQNRMGVFEVAKRYGTDVVSEIPIDKRLFQSYVDGKPIVTLCQDSPAAEAIMKLAEQILLHIRRTEKTEFSLVKFE
jgi:MinD superfamily P-loop ATPase